MESAPNGMPLINGVAKVKKHFKLKKTPAVPPISSLQAPPPAAEAPKAKKVFKLKKPSPAASGPALTTGDVEEAGLGSAKNKIIDKYIADMESVPKDDSVSKFYGKTGYEHPRMIVGDIKNWIQDNWNTFGQKPRDEIKKLEDSLPDPYGKRGAEKGFVTEAKAKQSYKPVIAFLKTLRDKR